MKEEELRTVLVVHGKLLQTDKQAGLILYFLPSNNFCMLHQLQRRALGRYQKKEKRGKYYTLNVERVVDDKVSIPHHGEIDWQVADVTTLVVILGQRERDRSR